jgi:type VI secretion system secreted protein Hcp
MMKRFMQNLMVVGVLAGVTTLLPVREANAAAYLKLGDIKGEATDSKHKDEIELLGWTHEVLSPRDAASGLPTGKRQHKPISVTIELSPATAETLIGLLKATQPMEATLTTTKKTRAGSQDYLIIKLEDVLVSSYRLETEVNGPTSIVLQLSYSKMEGKFNDGKVFLREVAPKPAKRAKTTAKTR